MAREPKAEAAQHAADSLDAEPPARPPPGGRAATSAEARALATAAARDQPLLDKAEDLGAESSLSKAPTPRDGDAAVLERVRTELDAAFTAGQSGQLTRASVGGALP